MYCEQEWINLLFIPSWPWHGGWSGHGRCIVTLSSESSYHKNGKLRPSRAASDQPSNFFVSHFPLSAFTRPVSILADLTLHNQPAMFRPVIFRAKLSGEEEGFVRRFSPWIRMPTKRWWRFFPVDERLTTVCPEKGWRGPHFPCLPRPGMHPDLRSRGVRRRGETGGDGSNMVVQHSVKGVVATGIKQNVSDGGEKTSVPSFPS